VDHFDLHSKIRFETRARPPRSPLDGFSAERTIPARA